MSEPRSVEGRIDEIESRVAISALVAGYCAGLDHRNYGLFTGLWHADGEYRIPGRAEYSGIAEIHRSLEVIDEIWIRNWHWTSNHRVTFTEPDRASGRSDVFSIGQERSTGGTCLTAATYEDEYERRQGQWRFASRTTIRWFVTPAQDIPLPPPS
ncbi:unannotated protein [freshwater metagenome]|uniref:Unannotated protein n=1 Tax=freshwater metagenome TaxID=449393 RepID=A0A6J7KDG3_9ZZZZ